MSNKSIAVIACVLLTTTVARPAQTPKTGNLTEHRLDRLIRGLTRNDVTAQLTCVVELEQAVDNATPGDLVLLRKRAVPALKACIRRETTGRTGRPQVAAMMRRILEKILQAGVEPDPPTDLTARSQTLVGLIARLGDADETVKRRALTQLRWLKALGAPALPAARHLAANTTDKLTRRAAQVTVKALVSELWFAPGLADAASAPPDKKGDPHAIRKQLQDMVEKLIERLNKPPDRTRTRAMRQLAGMKASADAAIDKLTRIALDRKESRTIRKAAGMTIRTINIAKAEAEKWRRWQKKKKDAEARDRRRKSRSPGTSRSKSLSNR
ncbi:MAG: hypothetical protein QGH60_08140 [Phycisphaerae bacterium]|nr:hypothetical protein [Phycisphaerae bacterium]